MNPREQPVDVVTQDNVDAYLVQWKKWEKGEE